MVNKPESYVPAQSDIEGWSAAQVVVFLEKITGFERPLLDWQVKLLADTYLVGESGNVEILSRYLTIGMKARDRRVYLKVAEMLGKWGRMKYVRPLYKLLNECDRDLALETFDKNIMFYHPICRAEVMKDLSIN
jgi:leukotriene-A4 hydrolase